jgi:hypothetical protein
MSHTEVATESNAAKRDTGATTSVGPTQTTMPERLDRDPPNAQGFGSAKLTCGFADRSSYEKKSTSLEQLEVSYSLQPMTISKCGLHELENDLIAGYYDVRKTFPSLQFFTAPWTVAEST